MRFGRLFWKLFLGNAVLVAAVLAAFIWLIVRQVDQYYVAELTTTLHSQAEALGHLLEDRLTPADSPELNRLAREISHNDPAGIRITFIDAGGAVLGDSDSTPASMESHRDRPEVRQAAREGWGQDMRMSHTLGRQMKYVAVRVGPPQSPAGYVRLAMPMRVISEHSESMRRLFWSTGVATLAACILLAMGLARLWSRPVRQITRVAKSLSRGDLNARLRVTGGDELAELARSLNEMRDHIVAHLETIDRQRRMLQSLLAQLQEGVIVTRPDGHIALINPAAVRLMGATQNAEQLIGAPVEVCVTSHRLQKILAGTGESDTSIHEVQMNVQGESSRVSVLAQACNIALETGNGEDAAGAVASGRLLVLTDVTPLARMIQVKADFAANASHELRTPLSAIRAATETLMSIDPSRDAVAVQRFAAIIDRQSSRMEALVRDLLDLSRIESSPASSPTGPVSLPGFLADLHARYRERLELKSLQWTTDLPSGLPQLQANAHLLRLVLDNLVDNAVKFTASGGHIRVSAFACDEGAGRFVRIEVADDGCGIPPEEQERVFERFYQVERSRSGADRGTGLGLSIVRHAVAALGGTVRLASEPGRGTTVSVTLPISPDAARNPG
jgi:two-component system phosphate regulon sensor histidine kinase PhoR